MKNKNIKMIVGAIAGVLLIAGVMFFVFKDNGSDQVVEAPVVEEQVVEENTNQFAQDIIMRAQETAEAEPEEAEIEEVAEDTEEEQTSIVASDDVDSTDEEISDDVIVISKDASPSEIVEAIKEKDAKKKETSGGTGTKGTAGTSDTTPSTGGDGYVTPEGQAFIDAVIANGGTLGVDESKKGAATTNISDTQFGINLQ